MAPTVLPAQLVALQQLLVAHPRQRSFEKQASLHPSLKSLTAKIITTWYTEQQRIKQQNGASSSTNTRARPPPRPLVITRSNSGGGISSLSGEGASPSSSSRTLNEQQQHLKVDISMETPPATPITPSASSGDVVRPSPVRSSPKTYSPTTLSTPKTHRNVVDELESIVEQKEECGACLRLKPVSITIGGWKREHKPQAPLTVSIECSGAIEITTRHEDTIYRLRVPLTQLSHLTLQDSLLTLSLLLPPDYYQRPITKPGQPRSQWKSCNDFTANGDATYSSIFLIELNPDHPSTRELRDNQLVKPLMLVLPPTPTEFKKDFPTLPSTTSISGSSALQPALPIAEAPTSRLFLAAHSQAIAQRASFLQAHPLFSNPAPSVYAIPHACTYASPVSPSSPSPSHHLASPSRHRQPSSFSAEQEEREFEAWYRATGGRAETVSVMEVDSIWSQGRNSAMIPSGERMEMSWW
ncbi:hypothetical protein BCR35DRAFT_313693 [Leucosporidium creatinivorum]|uniref:Uncharacterized protein n=1 Tax=Leucosporidium creatinivorum TaxID=106004 RepID=A0A1Y2FGD9_9BASI|nr:hypothetical protein BCR35DRAFT_313693 [Leucosporidium creatinivorum]